jgi:DNA polymerase III subunit epsilon
MKELVILDFETTGLSPAYARIIEVGAVLVRDSKIVEQFSELMDPGCSVPYFITEITGITNQMVKGKPSPEKVMPKLKKFIGNRPILAHNATFDQKFLISEMQNIGAKIDNTFLCTMKLSRRLIPDSPDYKLTTLVSHLNIKVPKDQKAHRALGDVLRTYHVWLHLKETVAESINATPDIDLFLKLEGQPKSKISDFLAKLGSA